MTRRLAQRPLRHPKVHCSSHMFQNRLMDQHPQNWQALNAILFNNHLKTIRTSSLCIEANALSTLGEDDDDDKGETGGGEDDEGEEGGDEEKGTVLPPPLRPEHRKSRRPIE